MSELNLELATRRQRFAGAMIDSLVAVALFAPIVFATGAVERQMRGDPIPAIERAVYFVGGLIAWLLVNGYLLQTKGQTVGKLLANTRIVDLAGRVPTLEALFVRRHVALALAAQAPIVGPLLALADVLAIFGDERRCLHDYLAGTVVVSVRPSVAA